MSLFRFVLLKFVSAIITTNVQLEILKVVYK